MGLRVHRDRDHFRSEHDFQGLHSNMKNIYYLERTSYAKERNDYHWNASAAYSSGVPCCDPGSKWLPTNYSCPVG